MHTQAESIFEDSGDEDDSTDIDADNRETPEEGLSAAEEVLVV